MKPKKKIILVCTSDKPKQSDQKGCLASGSDKIVKAFQQKEEAEPHLVDTLEVKGTLCLNNCANAVCVRIFPGNAMYERIQPEHVEEVWESHIKNNQEVKHLLATKNNRFLGF